MKKSCFILPLQALGDMEKTWQQNAMLSIKNQEYGKQLLLRIEQKGMNEDLATELRAYLVQSAESVNRMRADRKPFTDLLVGMRDKFTAQENAIDPKKPNTPAFLCEQCLQGYLLKKRAIARKRLEQLEKQHQITLMRIRRRTNWSEAQKEEAIKRADERLLKGKQELQQEDVKTQLVPQPVAPEGYVELFKFWWEGIGKGLPAEDLDRALHPMLMFAKKQAAKGMLIQSEWVGYVERCMN